jgi:DNA-binding PucR family transcriptional regulator
VFWEECTAEVASLGLSRDAAVNLARKMSEAMDTLTTHAAAAYVREESSLRASSERAARDLLDRLLRGDVDATRVEPYGAAPGLDPQEPLVVVVGRVSAEAGSPANALELAAAALADSLATQRASALVVVRERAIVGVVPADEPDRRIADLIAARNALSKESGISLYCGFSTPCAGFSQVAAAYEQASLALSRTSEGRPVISLATLPALQHLLLGATGATRAQLLDRGRVIADLPRAAGTTLKQTIYAFARSDMNVTKAAADLHIHENTLRYRLRRIREQTGHDPRTFDGVVELICLIEALNS